MAKNKRNHLYFFVRALLRPIFNIKYRTRYTGIENIPSEGAYILASNHLEAIDPILISAGVKRQVNYMAKAELFEKKFVGGLLSRVGAFPVERGTSAAKGAIKHFEEILSKGELMGIFIEGTRSKTGEFLPPKNGVSLIAYDTKTPVIPVCITHLGKKRAVRIGEPLSLGDMGFEKGGAKEFRTASRTIMDKIKELREQELNA